MNVQKLYHLLLLLLLSSCNNSPKTFLELFPNKVMQKLSLVECFPLDSLGAPDAILAVDNYWFFLEPKLDYQLTCYDVCKDRFSHKLMKGGGPDDVLSVQTMGLGNTYNEIYVTDLMAQNIYKTVVDDSLAPFSKEPKWGDRFCDVAYDDGTEFALLVGKDKRFSLRNEDGVRFFGDNIDISGVKPEIASQVLQGPCIVSPIEKKIVWFSAYGDVMEVYSYKDLNKIALVNRNVVCLPVFDKESDNGVMDFQTKMGVTSLTATDKNIYVLYNERNLKEAIENRNDAFFTNKILIFNWEGKPCKILEVDRQIKSISYDRRNNVMLCLGLNENFDYAMYSFPIK